MHLRLVALGSYHLERNSCDLNSVKASRKMWLCLGILFDKYSIQCIVTKWYALLRWSCRKNMKWAIFGQSSSSLASSPAASRCAKTPVVSTSSPSTWRRRSLRSSGQRRGSRSTASGPFRCPSPSVGPSSSRSTRSSTSTRCRFDETFVT